MMLCYFLTSEMFSAVDESGILLIAVFPPSLGIMFARFACAFVLHMKLQDELKSGRINMKLALNHRYRFENPGLAFAAGFLQTTCIYVLEIVNMIVIL